MDKDIIKFGSTVNLKTFHDLKVTPDGTREDENYWQLIGVNGVVVSKKGKVHPAYLEKGERVLVRFDDDVSSLGLACHNEIENSLWIFVSDLEVIQK